METRMCLLRLNTLSKTDQQQLSLIPKAIALQEAMQSSPSDNVKLETVARNQLVKHIEGLLLKSSMGTSTSDSLQVSKVARALEGHLHRKSRSLEAHLNTATLNSRLQVLLKTLLKRRVLKKKQQELHRQQERIARRQEVLRQTVGKDNLKQILSLVETIGSLKVSSACCFDTNTACREPQCLSSQQPPPLAVQEFFFHTPLTSAVEQTPLSQIPSVDWTRLMNQAQTNVSAFQEWVASNNKSRLTQERRISAARIEEPACPTKIVPV